jgi:hypothetical protein
MGVVIFFDGNFFLLNLSGDEELTSRQHRPPSAQVRYARNAVAMPK